MDIKTYIAESEKQYKFRLKSVVPLDDEAMDAIETAMIKYQPLELSSPKKTIMQSHPLDFVNIPAAEVYIVDMVFGLPVSESVLREDIRKALDCPETYVVVRTPNEAVEIENERRACADALEAERKKKRWRFAALLDTGADYPEYSEVDADDLYGDGYNGAFLSYLETVRRERDDARVKAKNAPFVWLDIPDRQDQEPVQDGTNFNQHIKGAPKIKPGLPRNAAISDRKITGGVDDRVKITRLYKDKDGNRKAASLMMGETK